MRRCGLIEITCPSGPKGGTRPSPSGDAIMFGPKAQKGVGVFLARTIYIYIYIYCRDPIYSTTQMDGQWPNEPKTMNLLKSGLKIKLSMS